MKKLLPLPATLAAAASSCATQPAPRNANNAPGGGDSAFKSLHDRCVVEFLRRNPQVNTYLGGACLDPSLTKGKG